MNNNKGQDKSGLLNTWSLSVDCTKETLQEYSEHELCKFLAGKIIRCVPFGALEEMFVFEKTTNGNITTLKATFKER